MGGCSASKMLADDQNGRKNSKFGFRSSFNHKHSATSLNASQSRIKNLADTNDTTYEIVKGGKPVNGEKESEAFKDAPFHMKDAGSQTTIHHVTLEPKSLVRPAHLPGNSASSSARSQISNHATLSSHSKSSSHNSQAPLATVETASELGTPTPMDENKLFIRSQSSFLSALPAPGQQRFQPPRFAPAPRIPSVSSSAPGLNTIHVRPKEPPPRPPPGSTRTFFPPATLIAPTKNGADNVLVSTSSLTIRAPVAQAQSVGDQGLMRPGSLGSSQRGLHAREPPVVESVRSGSVLSQRKFPDVITQNGEEKLQQKPSDLPQYKFTPLTNVMPTGKIAAPKPGLRMPSNERISPKTPLSLQPMRLSTQPQSQSLQPQKPARKSPQPLPGAKVPVESAAVRQPSVEDLVAREELAYEPEPRIKQFAVEETRQAFGYNSTAYHAFTRHVFDEVDNVTDIMNKMDDGDWHSEREAPAERPKEYYIDDLGLGELLAKTTDAKQLANEILCISDTSAQILNKGSRGLSSKTSAEKSLKNGCSEENLETILRRPTDELLRNPDLTLQLITKLQIALSKRILHKET